MKRHVLATAYACEPGVGSESGIGWHWALEIAKRNELTLVTRENNVEALRKEALRLGVPMNIVGFDLPLWIRRFKKGGRGAVAYFALWQKAIADVARKIHEENPIDVVHHLTFASSWIGTGLAYLDLPFVWGPVGQHPRIPDDAILPRDVRFRLREVLKSRVRKLGARSRILRDTLDSADVILSLGEEFEARIPVEHQYKVMHMLAGGVAPVDWNALNFERGRNLEILYVGRLTDLKGVRLALEAFGKLRYRQPLTRMTFLGEGERRKWLQARVRELGLGDAVRFLGHVPQSKVFEQMRKADLFLFPSFEGGGMVVLEAMAAGLPVVCLDRGGPGEMVATNNGISIPYIGYTTTQETLALGMELLVKDETLRQHVARNGAQWVANAGTWEAKGEQLDRIYEQAVEHHRRVVHTRNQVTGKRRKSASRPEAA
ncbi:MAG: glycosyltransferase family 4 protein [Planctomycetes bacterium]|nr:glycosyltransferase family 4 protein [Planctomycetota bacterium]MCB9909677.1 glycosyltransferase family 4 protein [Planctomycetota bacterium]MCB9911834.1 glycosyltransferase family 4 protein [Planctomycetota bacterium]HPF14311.1 glycosyltransferase family 4 protein [Planctomycetota bacterium]HRV80517.1 glycosyltransferase family 4 protein [Planctomycetota bacterium]